MDKLVSQTEIYTENLVRKIRDLLKCCPVCGKPLQRVKDVSYLQCADLFHGKFIITWTGGGYMIEYKLPRRAIS